jgi:hypothetical protein
MDPKVFGRGTWFFIFVLIYHFIHLTYKEIDNFFKSKEVKKYSEPDEYYIKIIENKYLELLKKKISIIISSLPCNECKQHSNHAIIENNIYNATSIYVILHFFIELRNNFYNNKIDRLSLKNVINIIENEKKVLREILLE